MSEEDKATEPKEQFRIKQKSGTELYSFLNKGNAEQNTSVAEGNDITTEIQNSGSVSVSEQNQNQDDNQDPKDKWLSKYHELTKRDEHIRKREAEIKQREEELARQSEEDTTYKSDPIKLLEKYGFSPDELVDKFLEIDAEKEKPRQEDEIPHWAKSIQEKIEASERRWQEKQEAEEKAEKERQAREQENQIKSYKTHIKTHLAGNLEKFEAINSIGDIDENTELVFNVIAQHYEETQGDLMELDKAAELVEQELVGRAKQLLGSPLIQKMLGSNKGEQTPKEKLSFNDAIKNKQSQQLSNENQNSNQGFEARQRRARSLREHFASKGVRS